MEAIGIICEYNPFHNGHKYHIEKIKEMYPDDIIILVINGYFLERGEISILSKEAKTKIALEYGVDLVLSLPFFYGSQSADNFAYGAIKTLNLFKISKIVFGSESNNTDELKKIVKKQNSLSNKIKLNLKKGLSYPAAISVNELNSPNDLLGVSYIKAINKVNKKIKPISIKRTNSYHDLKSNNKIISASNIRNKLKENIDIKDYIPNKVLKYIENINVEDLFLYLKYQVLTNDDLTRYLTVDEGIHNKIIKNINKVNSIEELIQSIKSKRYTYNRLKRMLVHILVGLKKDDVHKYRDLDYVQILGFNNKGRTYLNTLKNKKDIVLKSKNYNSIIYKYELKSAY
ncbi:MAG TPA: nucleotidyltransferase, partial [Bacilli bacterium]|nr:nucleotidyltransferase [Bacilli bacterium]